MPIRNAIHNEIDIEAEVNLAFAMLADPANLAAIGEAIQIFNVRLFLGFEPLQVKWHVLSELVCGVVTRKRSATNFALCGTDSPEELVALPDHSGSGSEGNSLRNVSRGDKNLRSFGPKTGRQPKFEKHVKSGGKRIKLITQILRIVLQKSIVGTECTE